MATSLEEEIILLRQRNAALEQENAELKASKQISTKNDNLSNRAWNDYVAKYVLLDDEDSVKSLVKRNILNVHDKYGSKKETMLRRAVKRGCYSICQFLLNAGSDLSATDERGNTPLDAARGGSWYNIERLFLLAQLNKSVGNEIQDTADNIQKQNGIPSIFITISNISTNC